MLSLLLHHTAVSHPSFLHLFEPKLTDKLEMSSHEQRKQPSICLSSLAILTVLDLYRALRAATASFPLCNYLLDKSLSELPGHSFHNFWCVLLFIDFILKVFNRSQYLQGYIIYQVSLHQFTFQSIEDEALGNFTYIGIINLLFTLR